MSVYLEYAHIVVETDDGPTVHTSLVGHILGGLRIVFPGKVTERGGNVEIAQRPEALRYVEVCLVAAAEVMTYANSQQGNALAIGRVHQRRMRGHRFLGLQLLVIEP